MNQNKNGQENASKNQNGIKSNPGNINFLSEVANHISDPRSAADARNKLAQSKAVESMCRIIEQDQKLTADEKLERLRCINELENYNKEKAHKMAKEFTWQDGLLILCLGGLFIGICCIGRGKGLNLLKLAT